MLLREFWGLWRIYCREMQRNIESLLKIDTNYYYYILMYETEYFLGNYFISCVNLFLKIKNRKLKKNF